MLAFAYNIYQHDLCNLILYFFIILKYHMADMCIVEFFWVV